MTVIKKILCALDFSPASKQALRYALKFADVYAAEVHLLHVLEPVADIMLEVPQTVPTINRKLIEDARTRLQVLASDVLTEISQDLKNDIVLTTTIDVGPVGFTVNDTAAENADLIVVGSRGTAAKSWWMSSVSQEIINHPSVPVLVVPEEADFASLYRISFATALQQADVLHLLKLIAFLKPQQPDVRCMHIVTDDAHKTELDLDDLVRLFSSQLDGLPVSFHQSEEDDITEALEAFNLMYHIDLQVMVRPRRNFFRELFHQSQSKKTAAFTHVPLLIWPG